MQKEDTLDPILENEVKWKPKTPKMQRIMFLNDDYTSAFFVVKVLYELFNKTMRESEHITMTIHQNGRGEVYRATETVIQTKVKLLEQEIQKEKEMLSYEVEDVSEED